MAKNDVRKGKHWSEWHEDGMDPPYGIKDFKVRSYIEFIKIGTPKMDMKTYKSQYKGKCVFCSNPITGAENKDIIKAYVNFQSVVEELIKTTHPGQRFK